jgi:hypothetical protein
MPLMYLPPFVGKEHKGSEEKPAAANNKFLVKEK